MDCKQGVSCYVLEMFTENLEPETVMPFLKPLMTRLVEMLHTPKRGVKVCRWFEGTVGLWILLWFPRSGWFIAPIFFDDLSLFVDRVVRRLGCDRCGAHSVKGDLPPCGRVDMAPERKASSREMRESARVVAYVTLFSLGTCGQARRRCC